MSNAPSRSDDYRDAPQPPGLRSTRPWLGPCHCGLVSIAGWSKTGAGCTLANMGSGSVSRGVDIHQPSGLCYCETSSAEWDYPTGRACTQTLRGTEEWSARFVACRTHGPDAVERGYSGAYHPLARERNADASTPMRLRSQGNDNVGNVRDKTIEEFS